MKSAVISSRAGSPRQYAAKTNVMDASARVGLPAQPRERGEANSPQLTPRQLEVLQLLGEGLPNKLICRRLNIATGTVKVHISGILRELGVTSRLQAVVAARRCGLLDDLVAGTPERAAGVGATGESMAAAGSPAYGTLHPLAVVF